MNKHQFHSASFSRLDVTWCTRSRRLLCPKGHVTKATQKKNENMAIQFWFLCTGNVSGLLGAMHKMTKVPQTLAKRCKHGSPCIMPPSRTHCHKAYSWNNNNVALQDLGHYAITAVGRGWDKQWMPTLHPQGQTRIDRSPRTRSTYICSTRYIPVCAPKISTISALPRAHHLLLQNIRGST